MTEIATAWTKIFPHGNENKNSQEALQIGDKTLISNK